MDKITEKIKNIPTFMGILAVIILVGIFLRTYNLHSWLKFRDDQARDAMLVSQVVDGEKAWPLAGPYMSYSGIGDHDETNSFHLGPIYYYFQITSAKLFGNYADKLAYPDVFFGILSILLLYLFLKLYFEKKLALSLVGLYAISAYFVQYSRFAWNTNLIPFFVLLLLLSLHKFLEKNEKTPWRWVIALGIALGVGIQLHAIIMVIFSCVAFAVFFVTMKKNYRVWKKWAVVLLVFCVLNAPQIYSELKTNFSNTRILFNFSSHDGNGENAKRVGKLSLFRNDLDCNIEANGYFLSSYGGNNCTYGFLTPASYSQIRTKNFSKVAQDLLIGLVMLISVAFSFFGYFMLIGRSKKETENSKKHFLYLTLFYLIASFAIMLPLSIDKFNDLRYYTATFFVPYVFLGFLLKFINEKFSPKYAYCLVIAIFGVLIYTNISAMTEVTSALLAKNRTCSSRSTTIGELEPVAEYMLANSTGQKLIHFGGDKAFRVAYGPLAYILKKHNIDSAEIVADPALSQNNNPTFMISCKSGMNKTYPGVEIGSIFVFRLNN